MEGTQPEIVLLPSICVSVFELSRDRNFGRFDFGRQSLPVLLFFSKLAPDLCTFLKCMEGTLTLLRLQGMEVLNYLDHLDLVLICEGVG